MADGDSQPHHPNANLPTLGSVAQSGTGLTVWCDDDACPHLREHGYRHQVIYTNADLAGFARTYGPGVVFTEWQKRLRCSVCGSANTKFVLSGHKTPGERWRE